MFVKHFSICLIEGLLSAGHIISLKLTCDLARQVGDISMSQSRKGKLTEITCSWVCLLPKPGLFPTAGTKEQKGVNFFPKVTHEQLYPLLSVT